LFAAVRAHRGAPLGIFFGVWSPVVEALWLPNSLNRAKSKFPFARALLGSMKSELKFFFEFAINGSLAVQWYVWRHFIPSLTCRKRPSKTQPPLFWVKNSTCARAGRFSLKKFKL